jgi:hypothetical protein
MVWPEAIKVPAVMGRTAPLPNKRFEGDAWKRGRCAIDTVACKGLYARPSTAALGGSDDSR